MKTNLSVLLFAAGLALAGCDGGREQTGTPETPFDSGTVAATDDNTVAVPAEEADAEKYEAAETACVEAAEQAPGEDYERVYNDCMEKQGFEPTEPSDEAPDEDADWDE